MTNTITDDTGDFIESKIDLGVHKHLSVYQEEYCFDIAFDDEGANLLVNSKEQMYTEKLRSLLKFGSNSTRFKDIFDLCFLSELADPKKLLECFNTFIFSDTSMKENSIDDIKRRIDRTFSDEKYVKRLESSRNNWLDVPVPLVLNRIRDYLETLD